MKAKNPLPVWYKPILSKEERDSPMLLCRKPELPKHFSRKRIKELATPKVSKIFHLEFLTVQRQKGNDIFLERSFGYNE